MRRMRRKKTRAELESALAREQESNQALRLFIRYTDNCTFRGWYFVESPRSYTAFFVHIDEHAYVTHYAVHDKGTAEYDNLRRALQRQADADGEADSFEISEQAASRYRAHELRLYAVLPNEASNKR